VLVEFALKNLRKRKVWGFCPTNTRGREKLGQFGLENILIGRWHPM